MKRTVDEHAARFDEHADEYDERQDSEAYRACASLVVEHARDGPSGTEVVLDLGCGTGAIGLALAGDADRVVGRDVSEGMLARAREKADERDLSNVDLGTGSFREPNVDGPVDVVVSNFALHHLDDDAKRAAIRTIADLGPDRFVLGDVMLFGDDDPDAPFFDPDVDDPATVGTLADALTDAGFVLTAVEYVHEGAGVLVAERAGEGTGSKR